MLSRTTRILLIILLALVVGAGGFGWYTIAKLQKDAVATVKNAEWNAADDVDESTLPDEPVNTPSPEESATPEPTEVPIIQQRAIDESVYNILLAGTDSRETTTDAEGRSDTMMVASYNVKRNQITLISFMRDSYVKRYDSNGRALYRGKLNAAYTNGGVGELINTLNKNFGLDVQEYVSVGFAGFWVLIDGFGGVDVNMTAEEAYRCNWRVAGYLKHEDKSDYLLRLSDMGRDILDDDYEGRRVQTLMGEQATWYCRDRYSTFFTEDGKKLAGDEARIARQQYVIKQLYQKIMSSKWSFDELWSMYEYASNWMSTNLSVDTLLDIGEKVLKYDPEIVYVRVPEFVVIESKYLENLVGELQFVKVDVRAEKRRLQTILYGNEPTPSPTPKATAKPNQAG